MKVYTSGENFNLCPAEICQIEEGESLVGELCLVDAPKGGLKVEPYTPEAEVIEAVERIAREAHMDLGGIEYIVDDRDGRLMCYDIKALSNFVADAINVIG